jgi:aryl-alcohol dehydrogenase-like predicted oxidoreductase
MTLIDTAEGYGDSEELIGKALTSSDRDRCFIASKVSFDMSPEAIRQAIDNSLRRMRIDYVDLYQVHRFAPEYSLDDTMETMREVQDRGKARFVGVSNFTVRQLDQARDLTPVQSNQVNYNMFLRTVEHKMAPYCRDNGVGILVHSTLAKGLLTGKYAPDHQFPSDDERSGFSQYQGKTLAKYLQAVEELKAVAADRGIGMVELAIAWTLRLPEVSCALVGAKNPEQLEAPVRAGDIELSDEEVERIEEILKRHKLPKLAPFKDQIV